MLQVGGTPLDPLFAMLGAPEEDIPGVMDCPTYLILPSYSVLSFHFHL